MNRIRLDHGSLIILDEMKMTMEKVCDVSNFDGDSLDLMKGTRAAKVVGKDGEKDDN